MVIFVDYTLDGTIVRESDEKNIPIKMFNWKIFFSLWLLVNICK